MFDDLEDFPWCVQVRIDEVYAAGIALFSGPANYLTFTTT
jgi:hypothetical protein